jgi:hypothetical protein
MISRILLAVLLPGVAVLLSGCGGESLAEVSGTVWIDGKPLPRGEIIFEAADGKKTPAAGPIQDGLYKVKVLPGSKKVKINASRPTAKPDPVMGAAAQESMIPEEFNTRTQLTAEIQPGKQEGVDFKVRALP